MSEKESSANDPQISIEASTSPQSMISLSPSSTATLSQTPRSTTNLISTEPVTQQQQQLNSSSSNRRSAARPNQLSDSQRLRSVGRQFLLWLPVLIAVGIFVYQWYVFTIMLCFQTWIPKLESDTKPILYLVFFNFFFLLLAICYLIMVYMRPGSPQDYRRVHVVPVNDTSIVNSEQYEHVVIDESKRKIVRVPLHRFCGLCDVGKPSRCHHCSTCGRCMLKMDHHCPWFNNCVAINNYKFFLLTLIYALTVCVLAIVGLMNFLCVDLANLQFTFLYVNFIVVVVLSFIVGIVIAALLVYHVRLVALNRTTIEQIDRVDSVVRVRRQYGEDLTESEVSQLVDLYDLGVWRNFQQVFGSNFLFWLLPIPHDSCMKGFVFERSPQFVRLSSHV